MVLPILLGICASLGTRQQRDSSHDVVWPVAVSIVSVEISMEHVGNLLTSAGIKYIGFISAGCSFCVDPRNLERAKQIVAKDKEKNFWHYGFDPPNSIVMECDADRITLFDNDKLKKDPLLRATALDALIQAPVDVTRKGVGLPWIRSIRLWEMPYLGSDFKMHRGIKAEFDIRFRLDEECRVMLTICGWNNGRRTAVVRASVRAGQEK